MRFKNEPADCIMVRLFAGEDGGGGGDEAGPSITSPGPLDFKGCADGRLEEDDDNDDLAAAAVSAM